MEPRDVDVSGYYVKEGGIILHYDNARWDGIANFTAYDQATGALKYSSQCGIDSMYRWAVRKATPEEVKRILEWKPAPQPIEEVTGRRYSYALRNALRSAKG